MPEVEKLQNSSLFKYDWIGRNTHRASSGPPSYFGRLLFHLDQFHHLQLFWSKITSNLILWNTFWWSWIDLPISMADVETLLGRHAPMVAAVIPSHQVLPRWPAVRLHCCWGRCSPTCWWWSPCWCRARRGQWGEEGRRGERSPQRYCLINCGDQLVLLPRTRSLESLKERSEQTARQCYHGTGRWDGFQITICFIVLIINNSQIENKHKRYEPPVVDSGEVEKGSGSQTAHHPQAHNYP